MPDFVQYDELLIKRLCKQAIDSPRAMTYFEGRRLTKESVIKFDLGYSEKQDSVVIPMQSPDGMSIGFEFQPFEDGTLLDYMIKNTNPQFVSFEMDVLWTIHGGGADMPVKLLKKYPGRFKLMHVKDLRKGVKGDLTGGTPAENDVAVGAGQGNWKQIIKLAKKGGVEHCFIEDESDKELENIPLSIAFLKSL